MLFVMNFDNNKKKIVFLTGIIEQVQLSTTALQSRKLEFLPPNVEAKQAWVQTMKTIKDDKIDMVELHPHVFGTMPR